MRNYRYLWLTLAAFLIGVTACSESSTVAEPPVDASPDTSSDDATVEDQPVNTLPLFDVFEDEDGPADLAGMVSDASGIFEGVLIEVEPAIRYYGGPDSESPDAILFEQVGLVFEVADQLKGPDSETFTVRWTSYVASDRGGEASRTGRVSIDGLEINEGAQGQRYGVFISQEVEPGIFEPLTATGLLPLNPDGRLTNRQGFTSTALFGDWIGKPFEEMIASES